MPFWTSNTDQNVFTPLDQPAPNPDVYAQARLKYTDGVLQGVVDTGGNLVVDERITNTNTSGTTPDRSYVTTYSPTGATTQQQTSFSVETNYSSTNAISSGGWMVSYKGANNIVSNAAVDKSVVYTAYTAAVGGAQVAAALGFEAAFSGLDGTSNITQYAGFYIANAVGVTGVNRINTFYGFACDYKDGHYKSVGKYLKAQNTTSGSILKEVAPQIFSGPITDRYYHPYGSYGALAPAALVANAVYTAPFLVPTRSTYTRLGIRVTTAQASGGIRLGIYYVENGIPTTLVVDGGAIDASTLGAKEVTISATLEAGPYALVALSNNSAIAVNFMPIIDIRNIGGTTADNDTQSMIYTTQAYGALASSFGTPLYFDTGGTVPDIWMRVV